jgi:hypothetical protein
VGHIDGVFELLYTRRSNCAFGPKLSSKPISTSDARDVHDFLTFDGKPRACQDVGERSTVHRLEKAKAEAIVDVKETTDDRACEALLLEKRVRVRPRGVHPRESALTLLIEHNQERATSTGRAH